MVPGKRNSACYSQNTNKNILKSESKSHLFVFPPQILVIWPNAEPGQYVCMCLCFSLSILGEPHHTAYKALHFMSKELEKN